MSIDTHNAVCEVIRKMVLSGRVRVNAIEIGSNASKIKQLAEDGVKFEISNFDYLYNYFYSVTVGSSGFWMVKGDVVEFLLESSNAPEEDVKEDKKKAEMDLLKKKVDELENKLIIQNSVLKKQAEENLRASNCITALEDRVFDLELEIEH